MNINVINVVLGVLFAVAFVLVGGCGPRGPWDCSLTTEKLMTMPITTRSIIGTDLDVSIESYADYECVKSYEMSVVGIVNIEPYGGWNLKEWLSGHQEFNYFNFGDYYTQQYVEVEPGIAEVSVRLGKLFHNSSYMSVGATGNTHHEQNYSLSYCPVGFVCKKTSIGAAMLEKKVRKLPPYDFKPGEVYSVCLTKNSRGEFGAKIYPYKEGIHKEYNRKDHSTVKEWIFKRPHNVLGQESGGVCP